MDSIQIIGIIVSIIGAIVSVIGAIVSVISSLNKYKIICNLEFVKIDYELKLQIKNINKDTIIFVDKISNMNIELNDKPNFNIKVNNFDYKLNIFDQCKIIEMLYYFRMDEIKKELYLKNIENTNEIEYGKIVSTYDGTKVIIYQFYNYDNYDGYKIDKTSYELICTSDDYNNSFIKLLHNNYHSKIKNYKYYLPEIYKELSFYILENDKEFQYSIQYIVLYLYSINNIENNFNEEDKEYIRRLKSLYIDNKDKLKNFIVSISQSTLLTDKGANIINTTLREINSFESLIYNHYKLTDKNYINHEDIPLYSILLDYITFFTRGFYTFMPTTFSLEMIYKNQQLLNKREKVKLNTKINLY